MSQNWPRDTKLHSTIYSASTRVRTAHIRTLTCVGTQTSGPTRFEMSCEGSSAIRKHNCSKCQDKPRVQADIA